MKNNEITKRPDLGIFDKQFPIRLIDAPIDDPTKFTILTGDDGILDDLFSYQVYNHLKNHWRSNVAPADIQDGMIWSETVTHKLYHEAGGADEEILQLTRSSDVSPAFANLTLARYLYHAADPDTYIDFTVDNITLIAGGLTFLDANEGAVDFLSLFYGLNNIGGATFITPNNNTFMTRGITIGQGNADDEILALKSSDVTHGVTDHTETDTYGVFRKAGSSDGGVNFLGYSEDVISMIIGGVATNDNTTKSTAGRAVIEIVARKKAGTGYGNVGADGNLVAIRNHTVTRWILDEDGDTWQPGEMTAASISPLILGAPTELTIVGGVITATRGYHRVDGQGDAADELVTIDGGVDGMILILQAENPTHVITVKHGTGNIELDAAGDVTMGASDTKLMLMYNGITSKWCQLSYSSN